MPYPTPHHNLLSSSFTSLIIAHPPNLTMECDILQGCFSLRIARTVHLLYWMKKVKLSAKQLTEQEADKVVTGRYNKIFLVLFLVYQVLAIVLNGAFTRPQPYILTNGLDHALFIATGAYLLVLVGFGLFFSYLKNYAWSGLGFTFLINAVVFQIYYLANGFWVRSKLNQNNVDFIDTHINVFLSNESFISVSTDTHDATVVGAAKCGLALSIAFAAIGGRAGYLEAFLIALVGTACYEINAQLVNRFAMDIGGSMTVFLFGGVAGTVMALLLSPKHGTQFNAHPEYSASKMSRSLAIMGAAFIWVLFPTLNMDVSPELFLYSNAGLSTIICISASVVTMVGICLTINGRIDLRSLVTAPIAGGVMVGSSSVHIYNPLEALILGAMAGGLQFVFNKVEVRMGMRPYWSNGVCFLFAVQGFLGGFLSSIFRAINKTSGSFGPLYSALSGWLNKDQVGQIVGTFISLGIGALTGLLLYAVVRVVSKESRRSFYRDAGNWVVDDNFIQDKWSDESEKVLERGQGTEEAFKGNIYL